jgi:hypothetical protein
VTPPLVSILIPTYNGERFLRQALRSASNQTHRHLEVLVGDDASSDGTAAVLAEAAAADARVRIIRHEQNVGAFVNPRILLEQAQGEFIKFLLHDDVLAPGCVHSLLKGMRSPSVSLAFSHRTAIDDDGSAVAGFAFPQVRTTAGPLNGRELGNLVLENLKNVIGELTTCLFRRKDVEAEWLWQVDGRQLAALGDLSLWLRLLAKGDAHYEPRALSSFRIHAGQRSQVAPVQAGAARDWPLLIDWGRRQGFLSQAGQELRAHTRALANAAQIHGPLHADDAAMTVLEAVFLSTARLLELRGVVPVTDDSLHLAERAHAPAVLQVLAQQLDVRSSSAAVAVAVPRPDATEVDATVDAFREMETSGAAGRFVLAVGSDLVPAMTSLAESALARGRDITIELTSTEDATELLSERTIAVAPPGAAWHGGRCPVWTITSPQVAAATARVA